MTLNDHHHQIAQAQPAYIVVEEEYGIESYPHQRRNNWAWIMALVIGGVIGLFWNSRDEAEIISNQQVQQIADISIILPQHLRFKAEWCKKSSLRYHI